MRDAIDDDPVAGLVAAITDARTADHDGARPDGARPDGARPDGAALDGAGGPARAADRLDGARLRVLAAAVLDDVRRDLGGPAADGDGGSAADGDGAGPSLVSGAVFRTVVQSVAPHLWDQPEQTGALMDLATAAHEAIVARAGGDGRAGADGADGGDAGHLLDQLHRAHLDERRRVARELHDVIAHALVVVMQDLELFTLHRYRDADRAEVKLAAALDHLRETLDVLRAITQDLRRSAADGGLSAALRAYLDSASFGRPTDLEIDGDEDRLSPAVHGELFLILREALRNAHLHAEATTVQVRVSIGPDTVRATVSDDGRGFDPRTPRTADPGNGLASMRERVALLGGAIEVRTASGEGTAVSLDVPLVKAPDESAG